MGRRAKNVTSQPRPEVSGNSVELSATQKAELVLKKLRKLNDFKKGTWYDLGDYQITRSTENERHIKVRFSERENLSFFWNCNPVSEMLSPVLDLILKDIDAEIRSQSGIVGKLTRLLS